MKTITRKIELLVRIATTKRKEKSTKTDRSKINHQKPKKSVTIIALSSKINTQKIDNKEKNRSLIVDFSICGKTYLVN